MFYVDFYVDRGGRMCPATREFNSLVEAESFAKDSCGEVCSDFPHDELAEFQASLS